MELKIITEADLVGRGVIGMADTPNLSARRMQEKVEEVVRSVVIPVMNENAQKTVTKQDLADAVFNSGAGDMQSGFYDGNTDGIVDRADNGLFVYTQSENILSGSGVNGKFKATAGGRYTAFTIDGQSYAVQSGSESETELTEGVWYTFVLDTEDRTINFSSGGGLSNSKLALATAVPEDVLLKLWEGLGYYNRARNLQKGALAVRERFGGIFPRTYDEILTLPGIGEYSAGAIASIAFGLPCPAVDGNVLRVIARVTGERSDVTKPQVRREIASRLASVYPKGRCGDFTQSLMELGATVCLPNGAPKCQACPLESFCTAHREGRECELPVHPEKKARRIERRTVFLLFCGDCVAVRKRPDKGVLARLWEFPNVEGELDGKAMLEQAGQWNIRVRSVERSVCARHIFTHLEWKMSGWKIVCEEPVPLFRWVTERELREELSLPSAWKAFASAAFPEENS